MFKVMYYKDQQYWGSSTHNTQAEAYSAIQRFYSENPGDAYSAFIA